MIDLNTIDFNSIESVGNTVLGLIPQQKPFRFIERISEIDPEHIVGHYHFKTDESFYAGHFPGAPTTPGVILIETMAQTGVVALGLYLALLEYRDNPEGTRADEYRTVFTDVNAEFSKPVLPDDEVVVKARKVYWRRRKLKVEADLYLSGGDLAASATLSGIGVRKQ